MTREEPTAELLRYVDIDIWCGDTRVERLTLQNGDDFEAEVHCDDYRIEVVDIREVQDRGENDDGSGSYPWGDNPDPHADDYCVVCERPREIGLTMHPVNTIENGRVCEDCVDNAAVELPWSDH